VTPNPYLTISYGDVALAALLVLVNGVVSVALGLGIERRLAIASGRMVVQLLLVGLLLEWVFAIDRAIVVIALGSLMACVAALAAVGQVARPFPGLAISTVIPIWASAWLVTLIGATGIIAVEPWYNPQYVIPLIGMVLGNALTGIAVGLDRLTDGLHHRRREIEMFLVLGATRTEAGHATVRDAVRAGMIPILNAMAIAGVVSLPGMMTGQILAGVAPGEAVRYQIVIFFLIAAGTALGTVGAVVIGARQLFDTEHRFRHERLQERP
jgi:putative ABC transport system permease protein